MLRSRGFTLIEILVTLFIVALGVLGTASLQAVSLKMSQSGHLRSQAVILGLDMLERIEANNPAAMAANNPATVSLSYAPASLPSSYVKDCAVAYCSPSELSRYDLVQFRTRVEAQLPGATVNISASTTAVGQPVTYTVRIDWEERIGKSSTTTVADSGETSVASGGKTEKFSYTVSKTFPDRSVVI